MPPIWAFFSNTSTSYPDCFNEIAADNPPNPDPMTMTFLLLMIDSLVFRNPPQTFPCQMVRRMHRQCPAEIIQSLRPLSEQFAGSAEKGQAAVVSPKGFRRCGR